MNNNPNKNKLQLENLDIKKLEKVSGGCIQGQPSAPPDPNPGG